MMEKKISSFQVSKSILFAFSIFFISSTLVVAQCNVAVIGGNALFDTTDDKRTIETDRSVEFWMKAPVYNGSPRYLFSTESFPKPGNNGVSLLLNSNGSVEWEVKPNGLPSQLTSIGTFVNDGLFHHYAVVKINFEFKLYLDGNVIEVLDFESDYISSGLTSPMSISFFGKCFYGDIGFPVMIDELREWSRALSELDVQGNMNAKISEPINSLNRSYTFSDCIQPTPSGNSYFTDFSSDVPANGGRGRGYNSVSYFDGGGLKKGKSTQWEISQNVGVVEVNNGLKKSTGTSWGNSGGASSDEIAAYSDGHTEITIEEDNKSIMYGLSYDNTNANWNTIDFAIYPNIWGGIQIYESGSNKGSYGQYQIGDKLKVERQKNKIVYYHNGNLLKESSCDISQSMIIDFSIYNSNATVYCSNIFVDLYHTQWTDISSTALEVDLSYIKKVAGQAWNQGAASTNELGAYEDGWVQHTVLETTTARMIGLSYDNNDPNWNTIDFNFYTKYGSVLQIYEAGVYKYSDPSGYEVGDVLAVQRLGNSINYLKNGQVIFSSTCDESQTMIVDVSLYSTGATLSEVKCSFPPKTSNAKMFNSLGLIETFGSISVFPNPFVNGISIDLEGTDDVEGFLSVFDAKGRVVYEERVVSRNVTLNDISEIGVGLFLLKVTLDNGTSFSTSILKE